MTSILPFGTMLFLAAFSDVTVAIYTAKVDLEGGTFTCTTFGISRTFPISKLCDEKMDCFGKHELERIEYKCTNDCGGEDGMGCVNGACLDHYCWCNKGWTGIHCDTKEGDKILMPTMKLNCTPDGLQARVDHGQIEGYVFVKGPRGECKQNLTTASISTILNFSYSQCGIEDKGSIILVLKSHSTLNDYRANYNMYECQGKSFHVWERMEHGTLVQTLDPPKYRLRIDRDIDRKTGQTEALVEVEPASLYGAIVKQCYLRLYYPPGSRPVTDEGSMVSDKNGCPTENIPEITSEYNYDVYMSKWFVDRETDTVKATLNTTAVPANTTIVFDDCFIETCIGRCEPKCEGNSIVPTLEHKDKRSTRIRKMTFQPSTKGDELSAP